MAKRPNFLLFITDQHRADFLGCYGHPVLRTPHIDSIAAKGTAFDKFYVASPVCMPNRSSLMTCRMPSVHGVRSNGIPLSMSSVTFVDLLREAGYRTALIGKSHLQNFTSWQPIVKRPAPREGYHEPPPELAQALRHDLAGKKYEQETPEYWNAKDARVVTPFYGFDHVTLVRAHGDEPGGDYDRWLEARDPKAKSLLGPKNSLPHGYKVPQAYRTAIPEELYATSFLGERGEAYLNDADPDAPFFLMVSFPDPHHPFNPPGKYWDMYKPDQFPIPEAFQRNDWTPPALVQAVIDERQSGKANLTGMNTIGVSAREAQEARALTAGMIACVDDAIGRVLRALQTSGRGGDTVVMFTSDHGDHLGDHRLMLKGAEQYQSIVRVPLIWSDPQASRQPKRTDALASTIDIGATVLDRAKIEPFSGMQAKSLLPVFEGRPVRDSVFIQYDHQHPSPGSDNVPPRVHTLIDGRWRISVFHGTGWGELYDLESDPGEFDNLWDVPAHAGTRARMMEKLALTEIEHVDRVPLPTRRA
ncbi:MAG: sulfatase-like hydrolase/transferase [Xanthobacteraceae bacterium]